MNDLSFIEVQFPVSKLSKESYKERKANHGQTLTGLGKWWGRKPLVLVRACILGLLLPVSADPKRDTDIFLKLLTMDAEGLWRRKRKNFTAVQLAELLPPMLRREFLAQTNGKWSFKKRLSVESKQRAQRLAFDSLNYDGKLEMCCRPEEIDGPDEAAWREINAHLGTQAASLPELVRELGERRFGHAPRVGDAFCGGGSIPFEAARIGCDAYGSDLSPVAALLTWAAIHIVGGGPEVAREVRGALEQVYASVKAQVEQWGIERNEVGWIADAYLYCHEVVDKETGWRVPLAPTWVIGERTRTVARLVPNPDTRFFRIDIVQGVSDRDMAEAKAAGTWADGVKCPVDRHGHVLAPEQRRRTTTAEELRGKNGLRLWENDDLVPRPDDVFQERLYCIRWRLPRLDELLAEEQAARAVGRDPLSPSGGEREGVRGDRRAQEIATEIEGLLEFLDEADRDALADLRRRDWRAEDAEYEQAMAGLHAAIEERAPAKTQEKLRRRADESYERVTQRRAEVERLAALIPETVYRAPADGDLVREAKVLALLRERFADWQAQGFVPSLRIESGDETARLPKERGYTHWHHLFNPRQLLVLGLFGVVAIDRDLSEEKGVACLLGVGKLADFNSRLCRFVPSYGVEKPVNTFSNQALNTLATYAIPGLRMLGRSLDLFEPSATRWNQAIVLALDARTVSDDCDYWITDPPYADAINYEELSEFFLAWHERPLRRLFPSWYADSKRALAVRGSDEPFRLAMVDCYRNFATHMPDNGLQVVMFTHTSAEVWADLALILWASGLRVVNAWTIGTETEASGLKQGNYVQGTVCLVLRKQLGNARADLSDVYPEIQSEVENQLREMQALEDAEDPNFSDSDLQLAAYAAALRVLTRYRSIEDIDVERELKRVRGRNEKSPLTELIERAVKIASDFLVPKGIDRAVWRALAPEERLYVKGLEVESHGDYRSGVYMEFARGFGVKDYRPLLADAKANETRLKTPSEFKGRELSGEGFAGTLLRQVLFAVYKTADTEDPAVGRNWLRQEVANYWDRRATVIGPLLNYLAHVPAPAMPHWQTDKAAAELLAGMIANDGI